MDNDGDGAQRNPNNGYETTTSMLLWTVVGVGVDGGSATKTVAIIGPNYGRDVT